MDDVSKSHNLSFPTVCKRYCIYCVFTNFVFQSEWKTMKIFRHNVFDYCNKEAVVKLADNFENKEQSRINQCPSLPTKLKTTANKFHLIKLSYPPRLRFAAHFFSTLTFCRFTAFSRNKREF